MKFQTTRSRTFPCALFRVSFSHSISRTQVQARGKEKENFENCARGYFCVFACVDIVFTVGSLRKDNDDASEYVGELT